MKTDASRGGKYFKTYDEANKCLVDNGVKPIAPPISVSQNNGTWMITANKDMGVIKKGYNLTNNGGWGYIAGGGFYHKKAAINYLTSYGIDGNWIRHGSPRNSTYCVQKSDNASHDFSI